MSDIKNHPNLKKLFDQAELSNICKAITDTENGITNAEITDMLRNKNLTDYSSSTTKWKRLFNALANEQNNTHDSNTILNFIFEVLNPVMYINNKSYRLDWIRDNVNKHLAFRGIEFNEERKIKITEKALTISQAEEKADRLKKKLKDREVEEYILQFCKAELVDKNYFHAVLEACKAIATLIRVNTGLQSDGSELIDKAFGGSDPLIKINPFVSDTDKGEQKGFLNLTKGMFGTFRNPVSHAPKIEWEMTEQDALDLLVIASYIYRRIITTTLIEAY